MQIGKIKKIAMYRMDIDEITPEERTMFCNYGRRVITEDQYFQIGAIRALENGIESRKNILKQKKKRIKKISKYF
jgi:hypothetical protein